MILYCKGTVFIQTVRKLTFIVLLLFSLSLIVTAQKRREEPPPFRERLFFGGSLGLQFGTITDIQVSPVVGFWVLPRLAVAVGPDYRFYKNNYLNDGTIIYGGKGYLQFVVIQNLNSVLPLGANTGIFVHIENELLNLETSYWKNPPYTSDRFYINTVLAGAGLSQQIGRRSALNFMVLWALTESDYEVYSNPEIRISFIF
jgi:hypothetical protein